MCTPFFSTMSPKLLRPPLLFVLFFCLTLYTSLPVITEAGEAIPGEGTKSETTNTGKEDPHNANSGTDNPMNQAKDGVKDTHSETSSHPTPPPSDEKPAKQEQNTPLPSPEGKPSSGADDTEKKKDKDEDKTPNSKLGQKDTGSNKETPGKDKTDKDKKGQKENKKEQKEKAPLKGENHLFITPADKELPPLQKMITSYYGERRLGGPTGIRIHGGVDIRAHLGWAVVAFGDGIVKKAGFYGNAGILVEIEQEDGYTSKYAHLQTVTIVQGQPIKKGEKIGEVGCTGFTTGAHLHFALAKNGTNIDPMKHLSKAEDILRPKAQEIPETLGPQQCNGHFGPYSPVGASRRGPVIRGRNGRPTRFNPRLLRDYKAPEIPLWQSRHR